MLFLYTFRNAENANFVCLLKQMYAVKLELLKVKVKCPTILLGLLAKGSLCIISWDAQLLVNTLW